MLLGTATLVGRGQVVVHHVFEGSIESGDWIEPEFYELFPGFEEGGAVGLLIDPFLVAVHLVGPVVGDSVILGALLRGELDIMVVLVFLVFFGTEVGETHVR